MSAGPAPAAGPRVGFATATLHLGALWSLAFVQPLFGLLGDNAQFFVARANTTSDILIFAFVYALVPPLIGAVVVWAGGRLRPQVGWWLQLALVGLLAAAFLLPPLGDLLAGSAAAVSLALALGAGAAALYARAAIAQTFLTALSPAPLVFLVLFLAFSPVSELVRPGEASGSVAGPARSSTPIVHVLLDEVPVTTLERRDGSFESGLFPHLARFVRDATWYRRATTVADATAHAVPAQLTGENPRRGALATARQYPGSLFTLFGRSHDFAVIEPITNICPQRLCTEVRPPASERLRSLGRDLRVVAGHLLLPDDLREGLPSIGETWEGFDDEPARLQSGAAREGDPAPNGVLERLRADDSPANFRRITAALARPGQRPKLVFLHSSLPHAPWRYLPDGREYPVHTRTTPGLGKPWTSRQWLVDQNFQRHVLQVQYVDALLGRFLERLRESGLYERALIVVTADHGASFRAGELRRWVNRPNLPDIAGVPFFVKYPGQREARVDDRAVRTTDVLPTIARGAGVRLPWKVDGMPAEERPAGLSAPITVWRGDQPGPMMPLARVLEVRRRRNAIEAKLLRHGVYEMGPRPDLVGRRIDEAASDAEAGTTVEDAGATVAAAGSPLADAGATLDDAGAYRSIEPEAPLLPAFVSGDAHGLADGSVLAIAVNGRIRATTRVHRRGRSLRFAGLVPPESLRRGRNRVTVLAVDGPGLRTLASVD